MNQFYQKKQHKILIGWELPNALMQEGEHAGKPFTIHQRYTFSMSAKANLRSDLESWRGKKMTDEEAEGFDISAIIGKTCLLGVVHNNGYANISSVMKLPTGTICSDAVNPTQLFILTPDQFSQTIFDKLSDKLKENIMKSDEYQFIVNGQKPVTPGTGVYNDFDDDIPF